jgi:hypothetical protein
VRELSFAESVKAISVELSVDRVLDVFVDVVLLRLPDAPVTSPVPVPEPDPA